jgi:hypothetical protein
MSAAGFESFDDDASEGVKAKPQFPSEQSKLVPDGEYEVTLKKGVAKSGNGDVFTFVGIITSDGPFKGWHLERTLFFDKKSGTDEEKAAHRQKKHGEHKTDLKRLGFDVDNWKAAAGRPFSKQLALACDLMAGLKVRMRKKTNGSFENVYIDKRLDDDKPKEFTAENMVPPETGDDPWNADSSSSESPTEQAAAPAANPNDDPIPF